MQDFLVAKSDHKNQFVWAELHETKQYLSLSLWISIQTFIIDQLEHFEEYDLLIFKQSRLKIESVPVGLENFGL